MNQANFEAGRLRNSNFELLRLIAMLGITLNHFPWDYASISTGSVEGLVAQFIVNLISNFGGVGDCLFFGISALFISNENRGGYVEMLNAFLN